MFNTLVEATDASGYRPVVVVIDYNMGNLGSIINMFKRLGIAAVLTRDPAVIAEADKLVLPGVGAFDEGIENLDKLGLRTVLEDRVIGERVPILGICLGMQLMTVTSEEGRKPGLAWINADTVHFRAGMADSGRLKLPHIGWNFVDVRKSHPLLEGLPEDARFYFVHSYKVVCREPRDVLTETYYGTGAFTSAYAHGNIAGVQFHPEKSHRFGARLLKNFSQWIDDRNVSAIAGRPKIS